MNLDYVVDAVWHTALATQDDLQDVISLLSIQPANTNVPHTPGKRF